MGRLDGKVAIVTGAARGVGRGHALLLAEEGAKVVVNDLGGEWDGSGADQRPAQLVVEEIEAAGGTAVANYDDVADWEGGQRLVNQAIETFGDLDILICNAGILRDRMTFNMTEEEWDAVIRVHLKGHFVPVRWASAYWREKTKEAGGTPHGGSIVLTASTSGLFANAGQLNYDAAKSGIATMAIVLAKELSRFGVNVNAISPSARTRLTENTFGSMAGEEGKFDERHPDNVAPWVVWLCTEEGHHITGQNFTVGGGKVGLVQNWTLVNEVDKHDRWDLGELSGAATQLFGDMPTAPETRERRPLATDAGS